MADSFDWGSLIGPALGAGASLWAGNKLANTAQSALGSQQQGANAASTALQPYLQAGQNAAGALASGDVTQLPGYQSGLDAGQAAINRAAAARGNFFSGNALKAAGKYATDYNNQFNTQRQNQLIQLLGMGQNAANQYGNLQTGLGNAGAAANIAGSNSRMSGIDNALNLASQYLTSKTGPNNTGPSVGSQIFSGIGSGLSSLFGNSGGSGYTPTTQADNTSFIPGNYSGSDFSDWGFD